MPERNLLKIDVIRTDGATQPRAAIDFEAVFDYMDAMSDGEAARLLADLDTPAEDGKA